MALTDRHAAGERALRELLADAELPQPDEVEYEEEGIVFLWHDRKLCVVVGSMDGVLEAVPERLWVDEVEPVGGAGRAFELVAAETRRDIDQGGPRRSSRGCPDAG